MVQNYVASHPECLAECLSIDSAVPSLVLIDRERPAGNNRDNGFIDLLLKDTDYGTRYIVEIQLGDVDPSHIVRTADYVEKEAKLFPGTENIGVIIAENTTTGRYAEFLQNYSKHYKLVVLQMNASELDGKIVLDFMKTLDGRDIEEDSALELDEDSPLGEEPVSREQYMSKYGQAVMAIVDNVLEKAVKGPSTHAVEAAYKKNYIGLVSSAGKPVNWCLMWPRKTGVVDVGLRWKPSSSELAELLSKLGCRIECKKRYTHFYIDNALDNAKAALLQDAARKAEANYYS